MVDEATVAQDAGHEAEQAPRRKAGRREAERRAEGALLGLALGDALGMPTQSLSPAVIAQDHGTIRGLVAAGPHQEIAAGAPAGMVTDDTEQAILVGKLLLRDGRIEPLALAHALTAWEDRMAAKGSLDLLGPSTKRAIDALRGGADPRDTGRFGTTNGASMRIAPIGIATPARPIEGLLDAVVDASLVTHHSRVALQGAAMVAGVVSAGIDGAGREEALEFALDVGRRAAGRGHPSVAPDLTVRVPWAIGLVRECRSRAEIETTLFHLIGTSVATHESVVAAFALVGVVDDPWEALCLAASAGGDTDTVGAIAGAMFGALHGPEVFPADAADLVVQFNDLDLRTLARELLDHRERTARSAHTTYDDAQS